MKTLKALGKILKLKHYASDNLVFVLSHSEGEQNKHKILYANTAEGFEKLETNWKHFDFDTEVIDFCFGVV